MDIPSIYKASEIEGKWYQHWMDQGFFRSVPDDREPYTIVIPPPNVTGVLHMGHMLNNTIQDVLVRRARMKGYNACWVPGTDHASIATEAKVVDKLASEGISKNDLSREDFLTHAWEWTNKHGGIILDQLKKLGASCDWERTRFTMEDDLSEAVIDVFIDLYNKGLIYRGVRMVNWDPKAQTALSDEEVLHKEVNSKFYHVRYKIHDSEDDWIVIATTRPETILADTAIAVHPDDERFTHLVGKKAVVPIVNRPIPIIADPYVHRDFGTGALKVTPAHDPNDYELGVKHNLHIINILLDDGTMSDNAGPYAGMDRFDVREKIADDLDSMGYLVKVEDMVNKVGFSERTNAAIEPKLSLQWFCNMKELAKPGLEHVMNDDIAFHPANQKNSYRHWMENVKDWCISRQLWWGHRIPAWYYGEGHNDYVVAKTREAAFELAKEKTVNPDLTAEDLRHDDDVLDTWFSSWLWPISVFDGFKDPDNEEFKYYYPTNDLVTAPEIMFFWVARMVMAGYEYAGDLPFRNVYYTGIVRDKLRRKMSKSLGNSPDPIELMTKYGADGVRVGMLLSSPAGNDLLFDEQLCEQGRNFTNKLWNALRLVKSWEVHERQEQPASSKVAIQWMDARFSKVIETINKQYDQFRISDALMSCYKLTWDDFCSYYLEMVKPAYQSPIDAETYRATVSFFERLLRVLHPFTPFITEEIWHLLADRDEKDCIMVGIWPEVGAVDEAILDGFEEASEVISNVRAIRKQKGIPNKDSLRLLVKNSSELNPTFQPVVRKMAHLSELEQVTEKVSGAFSFIVRGNEYYIPVTDSINVVEERKKLREQLDYTQGFLKGVNKKLENERFVQNAPPQVIENERKKQADAASKIRIIEEQLASLGN